MNSPQDTLDGALDRASEIIWWNRSLTKLSDFDDFQNAEEFVYNDLITERGPYVEYVRTPKGHCQPAVEFLDELGYHDRVQRAVVDVLFGDNDSLPLYQHQAETIQHIEDDTRDNILAVPTATGKTEAFFLPVLNDCLQTNENGLKAIILYPMKTLEVDQLNRFLKYIYAVNRDLPASEKIKIGIWDGDTANTVGTQENEIEAGSPIRGLICPKTGKKLRVYGDYRVGAENEQEYSWIRVTREGIRAENTDQSVDILITNPEALDFLYVNNNRSSRNVLGETPSQHPLQHIVYDEAHVWSGIKGAAISLLSRRLKQFYAETDPQITMVSATVKEPSDLAAKLAGADDKNAINAIEFTREQVSIDGDPDFSRFTGCSLDQLIKTLYHLSQEPVERAIFESTHPRLASCIPTLIEIELVTDCDGKLDIASGRGSRIAAEIQTIVDSVRNTAEGVDDATAVFADEELAQRVINKTLDSGKFTNLWRDHVTEHIPEVATIAEWFEDGTGVVNFREYGELVDAVNSEGVSDPEAVLDTVMLFGRLAGILTDKYHIFLQPPSNAFWCESCLAVRRQEACPTCGSALQQLEFCKTCHYPYLVKDDKLLPLNNPQSDRCPGCDEPHNTQDINVPTSTLLTFMLTELCRLAPSNKTLVFSDSRSTSETVARDIRDQEYLLMAETLYVKHLLKNDGTAPATDLFYDIRDELREYFYEPLIANAPDSDDVEDHLNELLEDIRGNAALFRCWHLFEGALITEDHLYNTYTGEALALAHTVFELLATNPTKDFTKHGIDIEGYTYERLEDALNRRYAFSDDVIDDYLVEILAQLLDIGAIRMRNSGEIEEELSSQQADGDIDGVREYLAAEYERLEQADAFPTEPSSALFERELQNDGSVLRLVPRVNFCTNCYSAVPAHQDDDLTTCVSCGSTTEGYDRYLVDGADYTGSGIADIQSDWKYALDHWASDIVRPLSDGAETELDPVVVGQHKGDMPPSLRGSIEEGFRKSDPDINLVSATPTMELGIDIGTLDTVTQVGIPPALTNYVQRSGRTGRSQGSASLVTTVVQSSNPVDTHYFQNLESFFAEMEPVRVPDPMEFEELVAGHIMTEAVGYLARNQGSQSVFDKIYTLEETTSSPQNYGRNVQRKLTTLRRYVAEKRPDVREYILDVFGDDIAPIFDAVFGTDSWYSLGTRSSRTFGEIQALDASGSSVEQLSDQVSRLDLWLNTMGYLANYRSFGNQFPVKYSARSSDVEFEGSGRLFELFPGPENDRGGEVIHLGTKYIVEDVKGREKLATLAVCENKECERPFEAYDSAQEHCPHCDIALEPTDIHRIGTVSCRSAYYFERNYRTYPIMTTHIEEIVDTEPKLTGSVSLFGTDGNLRVSQFETLSYIHGFERYQSQQHESDVYKSEAVIDIESDDEEDLEEADFDDLLAEATNEKYAPVGQQQLTNGLLLQLDITPFRARYEQAAATVPSADWSQVLVSLEQAFKKAIAVVAECGLDDFRVKAVKTEDTLEIYIVDGREGGNGISWQVAQSVIESDVLEQNIKKVGKCDECINYCNQCLLLERTPGYYLKNDLLNKQTLRTMVGDTSIDHSHETH